MAQVTGLKERTHPGKVILAREMIGTGSPATDTRLINDTYYPIGSRYIDKANGAEYQKLTAATWTEQKIA